MVPENKQQLEEAFSIFTQASEHLSQAYQELQQRVEQLAAELAVANGELRSQYLEKEALSERLSLILAALPGGVVVLDSGGTVVEANPAALSMLGESLVGKKWASVVTFVQTNTPGEFEIGGRRVSLVSNKLAATGGEILMIQDITEAHNMKMHLERNLRLSSMGEMAAGLAHQLRTPLATAMLYTSHLGSDAISPQERSRFAEKALARLRHLEQLIKDMLLFVKGETVIGEDIPVSSLLHELQQVIEPQMKQRGLAFRIDDESDDAVVVGNRKALSGALLNLLENAMHASSEGGGIFLRAKEENGKVLISVCDEGMGIESDMQERLFEPFFTTRDEGTGLGLAIVRGVAQSHGGSVRLRSSLGEGSEFTLELPEKK